VVISAKLESLLIRNIFFWKVLFALDKNLLLIIMTSFFVFNFLGFGGIKGNRRLIYHDIT
jgi:hypothetical protein